MNNVLKPMRMFSTALKPNPSAKKRETRTRSASMPFRSLPTA